MRLLSPKPVPHSAGIGHAGVYTDKSTNRQLALINYWDDPHLIQFELATGKEITRYPLGQFYTTPPSSVEARQSVELDCEDRWFAMTCEGTHRHGEKESTLIIAHGNELSVLHAKGISNGLCVGKKWLAWDLRRTEAGQTDEVWLIYLPGDLTEASAQKLPIAQSSTSRPLPSFMALNEQ